ncbi:hypothetical protein HS99_0002100 [Kitasatospora aureofaciens]|uniref:Uncharacterized protein n=1 Tax=Kitasatospora aureofaciens TaxID=1894 RepID=A0A1E7NFN0_KITAU|nr:hypothetical protein HS99_0002100 [Kitasatospora aureofaciens]
MRAAAAVCGRAQHPPLIRVDDHDGEGSPHLHLAPNGEDAVTWLGRSCAAALAHVVCGDLAVTIGHRHAADCERFQGRVEADHASLSPRRVARLLLTDPDHLHEEQLVLRDQLAGAFRR